MPLAEYKGTIDFAIITIREDEFEAVLSRFKPVEILSGRREYNLCTFPTNKGDAYQIVSMRIPNQGNLAAQQAANDIIEELAPQWLLVVGIAGGKPDNEFSLGDVVVSTHIHDFTLEAVSQNKSSEFQVKGGPVDRLVAAKIANLPAIAGQMKEWNAPASIGYDRPPVPNAAGLFYGTADWTKKVRASLGRHWDNTVWQPKVVTGPIGASDRLIKDTELLDFWLKTHRHMKAVEMESAGVFQAAYGRVPMLAIRGISDIVGYKRDDAWTEYACQSAAAFAKAFLSTHPIPPKRAAPLPSSQYTLHNGGKEFSPEDLEKLRLRVLDAELQRTNEINHITQLLNNNESIAVMGPSRGGVSTFCRQLQASLEKNGRDYIVRMIFADSLPDEEPCDYLKRIRGLMHIDTPGTHTVLCVTGWKYAIRDSPEPHVSPQPTSHQGDLAKSMRVLSEGAGGAQRAVSLVAVGGFEIYMLRCGRGEHSEFNNYKPVFLEDFSSEQIHSLMEEIAPGLWKQEDAEHIWKLVGGHPYFVKFMLLQWLQKPQNWEKVENELLNDRDYFFPHMNRAWSEPNQQQMLKRFLGKPTLSFHSLNAEDARYRLYFNGLLRKQANQLSLRCPTIRKILQEAQDEE